MDLLTELKFALARKGDMASFKVLRDYLLEHSPDGLTPKDAEKWVNDSLGFARSQVKSLAELRATAKRWNRNDDPKEYDEWVLVRVKRDVQSGMGRGFRAGEVTLGSKTPAEPNARQLSYPCLARYTNICLPADAIEYLDADVAEDTPLPPVEPMEIELRKFISNEKFSEETLMFRAAIYVNGKHAGTVENDGRGGSCFVNYNDPAMEKRVRAWIEAQPPSLTDWDDAGEMIEESGNAPSALEWTDDYYYSHLAEKLHEAKQVKSQMRKFKKWADADRAQGLVPYLFTVKQNSLVTYLVVGVNPKFAPVETLLAKEREKVEKKYKGAKVSVEVAP